jgi:hypothetical protein
MEIDVVYDEGVMMNDSICLGGMVGFYCINVFIVEVEDG